jgi:peptidyl-prolyl cis-trans isomerase SurA
MFESTLTRIGCRRLLAVLSALAAACCASACRSTPTPAAATVSAETWAVVDGREIRREDVERTYRRTRDAAQTLSDDEALTAKLNILNDLIAQDILLAKARQLKLDVVQGDVDTAFANAKKNIPDEAFQQELTRRGLTPADMREGLRRELLAQKVMDQELGSKIAVSDQEVTAFFSINSAQFNLPEESYHLAQIVVTPTPDAQVTNTNGDNATTPQAAAAKIQMLLERLKAGASFQDLAMGYSEDPESAPRGGDLGLVPVSRLRQAPPPLRDAVLNKPPGSVSVASGGAGYTIVLVVAHEQAGQRNLSTPGVRERITETLRAQKTQLLRTAYLTVIRTDAKVVNYLARRLVESKGEMPGLPLATSRGK